MAQITVKTAEELANAVTVEGSEITLGADILLDAEVYVLKNVKVILNGFVLRSKVKSALWVKGAVTLEIDGRVKGSKVFGTIGAGWSGADGSVLRINGGEYCATVADEPAVQSNGTCNNITITCTGAQFFSTDDTFYFAGNGTNVLTNCVVKGDTGIYVKSGKLTLTNTKVWGFGEKKEPVPQGNGASSTGDGIIVDAKAGYKGEVDLTVDKDSEVASDKAFGLRETYTDATKTAVRKLIIKGFINGEVIVSDYFKAAVQTAAVTVDTDGGSFGVNIPDCFIPEGKAPVLMPDGTYQVVNADDAEAIALFGDEERAKELAAYVAGLKIAPVRSMPTKLDEISKAVSSYLIDSELEGTQTVEKKVFSKVIEVLRKSPVAKTRQEKKDLFDQALYAFFLLRRAIEA